MLIRLGLAAPLGFPGRGYHTTSVAGPLAAALLSAELTGLSEDRSVAAIGISLSQSSGVFEFLSNGSSVKSLHPGWAALGGVIAAILARNGMTGPETSLEGRYGLFRQFAGDDTAPERFRALISDIGSRWHLPEAAYKFYPCCHYLHPFIEAAGLLAERGDARRRREANIVCRVPAGEAPIICNPWEAQAGARVRARGRWSLPIVVAARLVEGKVDLATFEAPASDAVRELAGRMRWEPLPGASFPERFEAELVCETRAGANHTIRIEDVYGNHTRPPGAGPVLAKFRANAARTLAPAAVEAVVQLVDGLLLAPDVGALSRALRQVK